MTRPGIEPRSSRPLYALDQWAKSKFTLFIEWPLYKLHISKVNTLKPINIIKKGIMNTIDLNEWIKWIDDSPLPYYVR